MAAIDTPPREQAAVQATQADRAVLRWTGAIALGAALLLEITAPLYASMGTPPSLSNGDALTAYLAQHQVAAITTKLIDTVYVLGFIVFAAGLRHLIRRTDARYEWAAALTFGFAVIHSAVVLFGDVLGAAAALDTSGTPDPTAVRALTEATLPAFGAVSLIAIAAFLVAAGWLILAGRALPRWTGWTGLSAAVLNIAAVPTIYLGGDFLATTIAGGDPARPYSYATIVAGATFTLWLAAIGITMIWRGRARAAGPGSRSSRERTRLAAVAITRRLPPGRR